MKKYKKEIQEELEELAPSLAKLQKEESFDIPNNYFNQLPDQILSQINLGENKTVAETVTSKNSSNWLDALFEKLAIFFQPRVSVAFGMLLVLAIAAFLVLNNSANIDNEIVELSEEEIENYVFNHLEDFEETELVDFIAENDENEVPTIDLEEEDLDEYIDEIMEDLSESELEDLL